MANATGSAGEGVFLAAGVVGLAAGFKKNAHIGEYWWRGVIGVIGLMIVASLFAHTRAAPIIKGIAWLTFIATCFYAYPAFAKKTTQAAPSSTYKGAGRTGSSNNPGGSPTEGTHK